MPRNPKLMFQICPKLKRGFCIEDFSEHQSSIPGASTQAISSRGSFLTPTAGLFSRCALSLWVNPNTGNRDADWLGFVLVKRAVRMGWDGLQGVVRPSSGAATHDCQPARENGAE